MALVISNKTKLLDMITGFGVQKNIVAVGLYGSLPDPLNPGTLKQENLGSATSGGAVGTQTITWATDGDATVDITFYCVQGDQVERVIFYDDDGTAIMYYAFSSAYVFNNDGTFTIDNIDLRF